ncbi:hypothetical protein CDAR_36661 [Caerostris darwini]|uniref:Uncharacterized protein n=1 Tax=Caerostris darwini TaxID=1538125 RepID=A0AAV4UV11_9ARAC|nr:hypothetical protein CDAR_36661 [Caerostris darwini]
MGIDLKSYIMTKTDKDNQFYLWAPFIPQSKTLVSGTPVTRGQKANQAYHERLSPDTTHAQKEVARARNDTLFSHHKC